MVIWRYLAEGALDTSFGMNGIVVHSNAAGGNGSDHGIGMTLDAYGRILVTGFSLNPVLNDDLVIWRYLVSGVLDKE